MVLLKRSCPEEGFKNPSSTKPLCTWTQAAAGRARSPWLALVTKPPGWGDRGECPAPALGFLGTCCCACCSSMKWELANWSSRSRRPYLSVVPVLQFWPPLSPRSACESGAGGSQGRGNKPLLSEPTLWHRDPTSSHAAQGALSAGSALVQWCGLLPAWHNLRNARKGTRCLPALPGQLRNGLCPMQTRIKVNVKSTNAHLYTALRSKSTWSLQASSKFFF